MPTSYSTSGVEPAAAAAYWNGLMSEQYAPLEIEPVGSSAFGARFSSDALGPLEMTRTYSRPAIIHHTSRHVAKTSNPHTYLMMSMRGRVLVSHCGRDIELGEGDLVLLDDSLPYRMSFGQANDAIGLTIPPALIEQSIPAYRNIRGLRLSGKRGLGSTLSVMLQSIWTQVEDRYPICHSANVGKVMLDLLAYSYASEYGADVSESSVKGARRSQIKHYIETHLPSPELNQADIARHFGISPRYLRKLFAVDHEHISAYILRRRLEECALQLSAPTWNPRTITQIAFSWGFSNAAHFSRAFKAHFECSPREYRHRHAVTASPTTTRREALRARAAVS